MPVGKITDDWYFVCGVDVLASPETGWIVALGDSLTDANISCCRSTTAATTST